MRNRIFLMGLLAVSLGVFAFASAVDAAGATTGKGSYDVTLWSYCNQEYVSGTWSWHYVYHYRADSNGGGHYTYKWTYQFNGVGQTSGKKYTGVIADMPPTPDVANSRTGISEPPPVSLRIEPTGKLWPHTPIGTAIKAVVPK